MFKISAETYAKNSRYNKIDKEKMLWLRSKDIREKLGVENIYDLIDKKIKGRFETKNPLDEQIKKYKKHRSELINSEKFMYTHESSITPTIMHCRVPTAKAIEFRSKLGFKQHDIVSIKNNQ